MACLDVIHITLFQPWPTHGIGTLLRRRSDSPSCWNTNQSCPHVGRGGDSRSRNGIPSAMWRASERGHGVKEVVNKQNRSESDQNAAARMLL